MITAIATIIAMLSEPSCCYRIGRSVTCTTETINREGKCEDLELPLTPPATTTGGGTCCYLIDDNPWTMACFSSEDLGACDPWMLYPPCSTESSGPGSCED